MSTALMATLGGQKNAEFIDQEISRLILTATRENPISIAELALRTLITQREIKASVERLRNRHVLIGASRGRPNGYFMCKTVSEVHASVRPMVLQAVAMIAAARNLAPPSVIREMLGQTWIDLEAAE